MVEETISKKWELVSDHYERCPDVTPEANCEELKLVNPEANPGKYKFAGGIFDCNDFVQWKRYLAYGPEFFYALRPSLALLPTHPNDFTDAGMKYLFVNDGFTSLEISQADAANTGFNLHLHCFLLSHDGGEPECYHFTKFAEGTVDRDDGMEWQEFPESVLEVIKKADKC